MFRSLLLHNERLGALPEASLSPVAFPIMPAQPFAPLEYRKLLAPY
jgi:hypothetical protein